jgi:hypothetical protein
MYLARGAMKYMFRLLGYSTLMGSYCWSAQAMSFLSSRQPVDAEVGVQRRRTAGWGLGLMLCPPGKKYSVTVLAVFK